MFHIIGVMVVPEFKWLTMCVLFVHKRLKSCNKPVGEFAPVLQAVHLVKAFWHIEIGMQTSAPQDS